MVKTLNAIFDGKALQPEEPIDLLPNTHVRIKIEVTEKEDRKSNSFFKTARSLKLKGPSDWSARFEEYLYEGIDNASK